MGVAVTSRRKLVIAGAAVILVVVVMGMWWFQPHKFLIDQRMDEALPGLNVNSEEPPDNADPAGTDADREGAEPVILTSGDIRSLEHTSSGRVLMVQLTDGSRVLRFQDLDTENGPDLRVYLSTVPADGPADAFDDDFVDLGPLKGNVGNLNYELPSRVDIDRYQSAVIWCRRFAVGFAVAPLA